MKKYWAFFRLRFSMGLQYRAAALAGIATQFVWGGLEILAFRAFYEADPGAFPMTFQATSTYIWLQQAFLALFMSWFFENEIFDAIQNGNIAYEICRPIEIYNMWFARSVATRLSRAVLRCMPILLVAAFLPAPYGVGSPSSASALICTVFTMLFSLFVVVAIGMLIYLLTFFTLSSAGIRMVASSLMGLLQGEILPIPFFPNGLRQVMELLPFAAVQNVPFRVYSGDLSGASLYRAMLLQVFWLTVLVLLGKWLARKAVKKVVVQGG